MTPLIYNLSWPNDVNINSTVVQYIYRSSDQMTPDFSSGLTEITLLESVCTSIHLHLMPASGFKCKTIGLYCPIINCVETLKSTMQERLNSKSCFYILETTHHSITH